MTAPLYFEDLSHGQTFRSRTHTLTAEAIKHFAAEFDPQPFHLDEAAAAASFFAGLCASGWHTTALTMRLLVESVPFAGGVIGAGMDELRWPNPARPGDVLGAVSEIIELRPSRSRPEIGLVKLRITTANQAGAPVLVLVSNNIVPRRDGAAR